MRNVGPHPAIRLLLVEDDQESGASLRLMLEKRDVSVTWVRSAEEAVQNWRGGWSDVIVSDIRLGGMSGVDFLRLVRESDEAFPFILLTGFDSLETAIRAVRLGAQDYILKPLDDIEVLIRPIHNAVDHHRLLLHSRAMEHDLRESERRLSTLMSNLAGMAYRCRIDDEWTMEFVSDGCRDLLECEPGDVVGNRGVSFGQLIHPDDRRRVFEEVSSSMETGRPFRLEYRIITRGGRNKWVWEQGRAVPADVAGEQRVEGLIEDITDRRNAEDAIRGLNVELERRVAQRTAELEMANRELEAFSYSVSHDLRTPLRSIDGFSASVLENCGEQLGAEGRSDLERVRSAARKMSTLINALLQLSRLTRLPMKKERVDLGAVARGELQALREGDPARCIETVIADGLTVEGDLELIRIVMQNLVGNAWKFTGRNDRARIEIGADGVDGQTVYFVKDNGAGFDADRAGRLFEPFHRLHTEDDFPGTGIGLATVQRIIHRHGGKIWAEGEVGKGATFYFTI